MTSSQRGEYAKVSTIELVEVTREPMSREDALQTLELKAFPSPDRYEDKVRSLLVVNKDNVAKTAAIYTAHHRLKKDHSAAVENMRDTIHAAYSDFQSEIEVFVQTAPDFGSKFTTYGKALFDKSIAYCTKLDEMYVNTQQETQAYKKDFNRMVLEASVAVPDNLRLGFTAGLRTLEAQMTVAYDNVLSGELVEVIFDPVDVFRAEYDRYLQDIVDLKALERSQLSDMTDQETDASQPLIYPPRYEKDLQRLHSKLEKLGKHYFAEIGKKDADVMGLQKKFSQGFSAAVAEAKEAFGKDPGIWIHLNCVVQFLCTITILPAVIILFGCEKPEDRYRLFHGAPKGEFNMEQTWKAWHMDMLPDVCNEIIRPQRPGKG